jgi:hypothetical protein
MGKRNSIILNSNLLTDAAIFAMLYLIALVVYFRKAVKGNSNHPVFSREPVVLETGENESGEGAPELQGESLVNKYRVSKSCVF